MAAAAKCAAIAAGQGRVIQSAGIVRIQTTCPQCHGEGSMIKHPCTSLPRQRPGAQEGHDRSSDLRRASTTKCACVSPAKASPAPTAARPAIATASSRCCRIRSSSAMANTWSAAYRSRMPKRRSAPRSKCRRSKAAAKSRSRPALSPARVFKMGGKGMPDPRRRGLGDLLVQVFIEVPKKLSKEERTLLRELAELEHKHVAPERKSFFAKLKEYFTADEEEKVKAAD